MHRQARNSDRMVTGTESGGLPKKCISKNSDGSGTGSKRSLHGTRSMGSAAGLLTQAKSKKMMNQDMRRQVALTLSAAVLILAAFVVVGVTYVVTFLSTSTALLDAGVENRRLLARAVMDEVALTMKPAHTTAVHLASRNSMQPGTAQGVWPVMPETIEHNAQELLANLWVHLAGELHLRRVNADGSGKEFVPFLGTVVNIAVQEDMLTPSTNLEDCAGVLQAGLFLLEGAGDGTASVTDNPLKFAYRSIITEVNGTREAILRWTPYQSEDKATIPFTYVELPVPTCATLPPMQLWDEGADFRWYGPSAADPYKGVEGLAPIRDVQGRPIGYISAGFSVTFSFNPALNNLVELGGAGAQLAIISQSGLLLGMSGGGQTENAWIFEYHYVDEVPGDSALGQAFRALRSEAGTACPAQHKAIDEGERLVDAVPVSTAEYGLPPLEERWCVIQTYPRESVYEEIDSARQMQLISSIAMVALFICAMLLFVASFCSALRSDRSLRSEKLKEDIRKVVSAVKDVHVLISPMVLVSAAEFLQLAALEHYESLRDRGALTVLDSLEAVTAFKEKSSIIFFSHQWLSFGLPDNEIHAQLEAMKAAIRGLYNPEKDLYIWCDYTSIAQRHVKMQQAAIASLPVYARVANKFIIVAPSATHENTGAECNLATYTQRGWCRAEMMAKACGSGIQDMYTCTDASGTLSPVTPEDLSRLSLNIFEGNFSVPEDVEDLVKPVLGLYSLVLRDCDLPHMKIIHAHIETDKDRFFPAQYRNAKSGEKVKLFGKCIGLLEMYIAEGSCLPGKKQPAGRI